MSSFGKVIGGAYLDSTVATATFGSDLVVQTGFKGRKLTAEHVKSWEEIPIETKDTAISAMGKAAAGVALPGRFGKAASAAVGAAFDLVFRTRQGPLLFRSQDVDRCSRHTCSASRCDRAAAQACLSQRCRHPLGGGVRSQEDGTAWAPLTGGPQLRLGIRPPTARRTHTLG